jgi:hypothetical protein
VRSRVAALVYAAGAVVLYHRLFVGDALAGRDVFRLFIPQASFLLDALKHHALPLWLPLERMGQPFVGSLQTQVFYPLQLLPLLAAGPFRLATVQQLCHVIVASVGTFRLSRALRASFPGALLAGAAFGFSHLYTLMSWLPNMAGSAAWVPWIVLGALAAHRRRIAHGVAAVAVPTALALLAASPEMLLWAAPLALVCALTPTLSRPTGEGGERSEAGEGRVRRAGLVTAAGLGFGGLLSAVALVPALEFTRWSTRASGITGELEWSASLPQVLSLFWPHADEPRGAYWHGPDAWLLASAFVGVLTCALAVLALRRSRRVMPFAVAAALLLALSLGEHFLPAKLLLRLPPFDYFRYPVKYLVGAAFCIAVLAGSGLDRLTALARRVTSLTPTLSRTRERARGTSSAALAVLLLGIFGVAVVLAFVGLRVLPLHEDAVRGVPWMLLWLGVGLALFGAMRSRPRRLRATLFGAFALELAMSHAILGGPQWTPVSALARPSALARLIPPGYAGRISVQTANDPFDATAVHVAMDQTRDALRPLSWFEDGLNAIEGYGPPVPRLSELFLTYGGRGTFDVGGVSYFVRDGDPPFPDAERVAAPEGLPRLYRSRTALPRAFVTRRAVVATDRVALEALQDSHLPMRHTAFLAAGAELDSGCDGGRAWNFSEGVDSLDVDASACGDSYLVIADAYFPGWTAEVDGRETTLERADVALRAVRLAPGTHRVRMTYRPRSFGVGAATSALALLILAGGVAVERARSHSKQSAA